MVKDLEEKLVKVYFCNLYKMGRYEDIGKVLCFYTKEHGCGNNNMTGGTKSNTHNGRGIPPPTTSTPTTSTTGSSTWNTLSKGYGSQDFLSPTYSKFWLLSAGIPSLERCPEIGCFFKEGFLERLKGTIGNVVETVVNDSKVPRLVEVFNKGEKKGDTEVVKSMEIIMDTVISSAVSCRQINTKNTGSEELWKSDEEIKRDIEDVVKKARERDWEGFGKAFGKCEWRTGNM